MNVAPTEVDPLVPENNVYLKNMVTVNFELVSESVNQVTYSVASFCIFIISDNLKAKPSSLRLLPPY